MQLDLLPAQPVTITPEAGRQGPRLWVKQLSIWKDATTLIRQIDLRPGLNVVWSPDAHTDDGAIGHGAGKTMFCRLLRYCLGEDGVAPEAQLQRLSNQMPSARVSAIVMLDGEVWAVSRLLAHKRQDLVMKDAKVNDIISDDVTATGMEPLRSAIATAIIGDVVKLMPAVIGEANAWQAALAWLTRDQEVRLEHHLEWRSSQTQSHARIGRSKEDRLNAVRALLGMLTTDEIAAQNSEQITDKDVKKLQAQLDFLNQLSARSRDALVQNLGSPLTSAEGTDIELTHFRRSASERFAAVVKLPAGTSNVDLMDARNRRDAALKRRGDAEAAISTKEQVAEVTKKMLAQSRGQLPTARAKMVKDGNPVCPICSVAIDKVLAEGCKIAVSCDLDALKKDFSNTKKQISDHEAAIVKLNDELKNLKIELALAKQSFDQTDKTLKALEAAHDKNSQTFRTAQNLLDEVDRYSKLMEEKGKAAAGLAKAERKLEEARETLAKHREAARETIRLLSERFGHVVESVVQNKTKGEVHLDGNGLSLVITRDGDLSTAAIDSLKVLAFDLATMILALEGKAQLPSFFVHDSPREADLGNSIYQRLFTFVRSLENLTAEPQFQYILTTTSAPPEEFQKAPYLCLELRGSPGEERLLKIDL